jgi:hypothetical protein
MKTRGFVYVLVVTLCIGAGSAWAGFEGISNTLYGSGAGTSFGGDSCYATFIGYQAGYHTNYGTQSSDGKYNTFVGYKAGFTNTTGFSNTFLGNYAGYTNSPGSFNTQGYCNTFIGDSAGYSNTGGNYNTFLGVSAGHSNTTGTYNTFLGNGAGLSNNTGGANTFLGNDAGGFNTTGYENTSVGSVAGVYNTTGYCNTFLGSNAGSQHTTGYKNTFLGGSAGSYNTTGHNNTFLGFTAGYTNSGSGNLFVGTSAGYNETGSNKLYIDNSDTATPLIYGEFDNDVVTINGKLGIGTMTPVQKIDLGGGAITLNGSDNTGAMPPGLSSQTWDNGRIDFGYGGSGGGNLEAYSKAPTNYSSPADDRRGQFKFVYGGGPTMGSVIYTHYDGTTWADRMWVTYDGQLYMAGGAYTDGHSWISSSSRANKENVRELGVDEAMDTLKELSPVKFNYKADSKETHVGFIAEDVPALVATSDRKGMSSMDVVAVLTKVVQEQQEWLKELKTRNEILEQRLLALEGKAITGK